MAAYLGEKRLRYLQTIRIGIAGAGGLGSNCAMHLVRSGFRLFTVADFDRVEPSNLNRQQFRLAQLGQPKVAALHENMRAVNPDIRLDAHLLKISSSNVDEIFGGCDVIIEAFDDAAAKKTLVERFMNSDKLLVCASGMGGTGNTDKMVTRRVRDNFYIVGDMATECNAKNPPFSPRVGIAAAKQADVVLDHFLQKYESQGALT